MNTIPLQRGLDNWKPTNSQHLSNWLGKEKAEKLSRDMGDFYWPIPVAGVPGNVYAMPGGDFAGKILTNGEMSAVDRLHESMRRERLFRSKNWSRNNRQLGAFASADAVYAAVTGGKAQFFNFIKVGVASSAIGGVMDLWTCLTSFPVAGAAGGAAPGGTVPTSATTGAFAYGNPTSANTGHFLAAEVTASVVNNTLLLYDRIFAVAKTMNSTATEVVTGVPTRYTNSVVTALDYIGGNFLFTSNPTTVLPATAHNWQLCQITNDLGNLVTVPTVAGISSCPVRQVDLALGNWFMPLNATDKGVKNLTQMQCSALVATGTIDFVIGHPIAFFPCPAANLVCVRDGLRSTINLTSIFDNACLALMEMPKPATTLTTYSGLITTVAE